MKTDKIKMEILLAASPEKIYQAWLTGKSHSAFTGGKAKIQPKVNSRYSAWDGYITGKIIALEENRKITHSWRTAEFPEDASDSILEISFTPFKQGTKLILVQTEIPEGDGKKYKDGWNEHYFIPMKKYFSGKK